MKKVGNFLLALIVPKKMRRFIDMSPIIILIILLSTVIVSIGSNMLRMDRIVEKTIPSGDYNNLANENKGLNLMNIQVNTDGKLICDLPASGQNIFVEELSVKNSDQIYEVTFVFEPNLIYNNEEMKLSTFDLEGYYQQERKEKYTYLLYIFTETILYEVYDLGDQIIDGEYVDISYANSIVEQIEIVDNDANFLSKAYGANIKHENKYYLPASVDELVDSEGNVYYNSFGDFDTTRWTLETSVGVEKEYVVNSELIKLTSVTRHNESVNKAIKFGYSYNNLIDGGLKIDTVNTGINNFVIGVHEGMVYIDASAAKLAITLLDMFVFLVLPLALAFIGWLFSHKKGMPKFRNYLAIASIVTIPFAILLFIVGWFMYIRELFFFISILGILWYFVFAIFKINGSIMEEKDANKNNISYEESKPKQPVNFHKIDDDSAKIG